MVWQLVSDNNNATRVLKRLLSFAAEQCGSPESIVLAGLTAAYPTAAAFETALASDRGLQFMVAGSPQTLSQADVAQFDKRLLVRAFHSELVRQSVRPIVSSGEA